MGFAIDACATESAALVITIIKKINEVRKFKSKCIKLGQDAQVLQNLLDKNRPAITSFQTLQDFEACLKRINEFVDSCASHSILDAALEVFIRRKYPALRKEVNGLRVIFLFESVTEILSREDACIQSVNTGRQEIKSQTEILTELKQEAHKDPISGLGKPRCDFSLNSNSNIVFDSSATIGRGHINGVVGAVVCYQIPVESFTQKNLDIYRNIQAGAYVQRLYGTLETNNRYYAVMEDLEGGMTLAQACQENTLPQTLLERASLAYDLAKTVVWYHQAELLLRSITDTTVILKTLPSGKVCPFLTRLHNSRHIATVTSGIECDARYDAPEYGTALRTQREHSKYTDIWNLGTIIWQCIFGHSPYGISNEVLPSAEGYFNDLGKIEEAMKQGSLPGAFEEGYEALELSDIIRRCWKKDPILRPTAATVAQDLLYIKTRLSFSIAAQESDDGRSLATLPRVEESQAGAWKAIKEARELNKNSLIPVQPNLKSAASDFNLLLNEDDEQGPVTSFVLGAMIFWNLTDDFQWQDIYGDTVFPSLAMSSHGKRAELALTYLELAAQNGYNEAYVEISKAHKLLAGEFKAHKTLSAVTYSRATEGFV